MSKLHYAFSIHIQPRNKKQPIMQHIKGDFEVADATDVDVDGALPLISIKKGLKDCYTEWSDVEKKKCWEDSVDEASGGGCIEKDTLKSPRLNAKELMGAKHNFFLSLVSMLNPDESMRENRCKTLLSRFIRYLKYLGYLEKESCALQSYWNVGQTGKKLMVQYMAPKAEQVVWSDQSDSPSPSADTKSPSSLSSNSPNENPPKDSPNFRMLQNDSCSYKKK